MKVAIIGAGAAGLTTCRECLSAGLEVQVFEQGSEPGGIWVYEDRVEDDLLGLAPERPVYSSLYANLRTNLPSDLMAFMDYPFDSRGGGSDDWPRYPHHSKVLTYLQNFARDFSLNPYISLEQTVAGVRASPSGGWVVSLAKGDSGHFDAVAVCNGHFSQSRVLDVPGAERFRGVRLHSHNYRRPTDFIGQRVAVLGTGASGADIVQELLPEVASLWWCGFDDSEDHARIRRRPMPTRFTEDGLVFEGEILPETVELDAVVYCTGYEYRLPFLDERIVRARDNHVAPLYRQILPPDSPTLGMIGLPFLVVPFPLYTMQARWFVRSLLGQLSLPGTIEMHETIKAEEKKLRDEGVKTRHMHRLGDRQEAYYNELAQECGEEPLPDWFSALAKEAQQSRLRNPAGFRDEPLSVNAR